MTRPRVNRSAALPSSPPCVEDMQRHVVILHAVIGSIAALIGDKSLDEAAPEALRVIGEALKVDRCVVLESVDRPGARHQLIPRHQWNRPGFTPLNSSLDPELVNHPDIVSWQAPLHQGQPVITTRANANPTVAAILRDLGLASILLVPIAIAGKYWGQIGLDDSRPDRAWATEEIDALVALADLLGTAIVRVRQNQELVAADAIIRRSPTIFYRLAIEPGLPMTYVSANVERLGHSREKILAEPTLYRTLIHPDDRARVEADQTRALTEQSYAAPLEVRFITSDGSYRWFEVHRSRIFEDGKLKAFEGELVDIDARKQAEEKLAYSNLVLAATSESSPEGMIVVDRAGKILSYNRRFIEMWRIPPEIAAAGIDDAVMRTGAKQLKDPDQFVARVLYLYEHPEEGGYEEIEFTDGRIFDRHTTVLRRENGDYIGRIWFFLDITERKEAEKKIRESEEQFRTIFESVNDVIILHDMETLAFVDVNPRVRDRFGYTREEFLRLDLIAISFDKSPAARDEAFRLGRLAASGLPQTFEWRALAKDGRVVWVEVTLRRAAFGGRDYLLSTARDITLRKIAEHKISQLARTDPLTGLPNRRVFVESLQQAIGRASRGGKGFAVLYLDLDHFKDANDTLGHMVGDELLKAVGERLRNSVRLTDVVARFGGDEFAILQTDIQDPADAAILAGKLLEAIAQPFTLGSNRIQSGTSIGITVSQSDSTDEETLLSHADLALYRAKSEGRGTYRYFTESMDTEVHARVKLVGELRAALAESQLVLHYQPQVDARDGRITGLEALVRWRHPKRGLLLPGEFIRIAEETGLIAPLGQWVLNEACRQLREWLEAGIAPPVLAVNLSAAEFKIAGIERQILSVVEQFGIPPDRIELEITEYTMMELSERPDDVLARLKRRGIRISIDDFGTGYSSLAYLKRFRPTRIKIAQQFVAGMLGDEADRAVVRAIVEMAQELRIGLIAEGVESAAQATFLCELGCCEAQGFAYTAALPAGTMTEALRRKAAYLLADGRELLAG